MVVIHVAACNECRWIVRFPDGQLGRERATGAAYKHAAENHHAVARYEAELVELVEPAGYGAAYGIEVNRRAV